jgi:hypothetical protein
MVGAGVTGGSVATIGASEMGARLGNPEGLKLGLSLGTSLPTVGDSVDSVGSTTIIVGVTVGKSVAVVGLAVDSGANGQNCRSGGPRSF